jgi:hypothetical protein
VPVDADHRGADVDPDLVHPFVVRLDDRFVEVAVLRGIENRRRQSCFGHGLGKCFGAAPLLVVEAGTDRRVER